MWTVSLQFLSMEINHKKEKNIGSSTTDQSVRFSIRDYVAAIRKQDPRKCWPFGSLGDPENNEVNSSYKSSESTCLPTDDHAQATNNYKTGSSGIANDGGEVICDGSTPRSTSINNGQYRHEDSVNEGAEIGHNVAADNNKPERNRPTRKPRKTRLLDDIYNDPASKLRARSDITYPLEKVNRRFVAEIEEDQLSDDVTLNAICRKQKATKVTGSTLKKKRRTTHVEFSRVDQDQKSKHGSKESTGAKVKIGVHSRKKLRTDDTEIQTMIKGKKDYVVPGHQKLNRTEAIETANEDSEMEAVMLLASRFNEENPSTYEQIRGIDTSTTCACVQKKIHMDTTTNAAVNTHLKSTKGTLQKPFSSVQTVPKLTTATLFQAHKEIRSQEALEVMHAVQTYETLVCSVNRNPADFSIPNAENKFIRGG